MSINGTMQKIESVTIGSSGQSQIDFQNIPQTYTDLVIVGSFRTSSAGEVDPPIQRLELLINNTSTGNLYSVRMLYGNGSTHASVGGESANRNFYSGASTASGATSGVFSNVSYYLPNYRSNTSKSINIDSVTENNAVAADINIVANVWSSNEAVNRLTLKPYDGSNFVEHSTATLYGISPVTQQIKATGGMIYQDADYVYHLFTANGTFTPTQSLSCDYLVVAGGGGGGNASSNGTDGAGGGGAGGLRSTVGTTGGGGSLESALSLTANTTYTITVGAGGSGGTTNNRGANGTDSVFSTITSTGGGGGGGISSGEQTGGNGGSGGGGSCFTVAGGTRVTGQGYAGGAGATNGPAGGGGAGGAGADGVAQSANGGNGGIGVQITALATPTNTGVNSGYYAGGGGGASDATTGAPGEGGLGGGGAGFKRTTTFAVSGTTNTGGGGGGGGAPDAYAVGGSGGSGIVIIRYAK